MTTTHKYSATFDKPLVNKLEDVKRFANDAALRMRLKKYDTPRYDSLRADWKSLPDGIVGTSKDEGEAIQQRWHQPSVYSGPEFEARGRFSEATARDMMLNGNLGKLKQDDPIGYAMLVLAAASYDLPGSVSPAVALERLRQAMPPAPIVEDTFDTSLEMQIRLNLPPGKLTRQEFTDAHTAILKLDEALLAAQEKAEAEKLLAEAEAAKEKAAA